MKLGEKIKFFRDRAGLTKSQLARVIDVTEIDIANYEENRSIPSAEILKELSQHLKISATYFFDSEEKTLLQFPMDATSFKKWCLSIKNRKNLNFVEANYFEFSLKSDRYFVELNKEYLVWLNDGFYFIPLVPKFVAGAYYQSVEINSMRKVLNEDIKNIEKTLRKTNLFRFDEDIFAREVYVSKYDFVDAIYLSNVEEIELYQIASHCNHVVGYNEQMKLFYLLETNGIHQVPFVKDLKDGILNEKTIFLDVKNKKRLGTSEIKDLTTYVLNEEELIRRVQQILKKEIDNNAEVLNLSSANVFNHLGELEEKEFLHMDNRNAIAHFLRARLWAVDNIKRMLHLTHVIDKSIFDNEWVGVEYVNPEKKMRHQADGNKQKELTFLIADDSTFMRSVIINMMNKHFPCEVEEAADGEAALKMYEKKRKSGQRYDLIILDITMPKVDGFTLLKQIMRIDKTETIIMCSAVTNEKIIVESVKNGARHFIKKPIDEDNMVHVINKVLEKNKYED